MTHANRLLHQLALMLSAMVTLTSCLWDAAYPSQLTEADSLILKGDYAVADSLLADYDRQDIGKSHHVQMYRELLRLERRFVEAELTDADFSMADSLARYYSEMNTRETAMSQLFLGYVYQEVDDYPSALDCYLRAEQTGCDDMMLQMWTNKLQGDLYFNQRMLGECSDYYRRFYQKALQKKDLHRMASSSYSMGLVNMVKNNVDSIIFYLNQAISWGKKVPQGDDIVVKAQSVLADVYTQTEQFSKAESLLSRDTIDHENWAYWHLGQHHTDSAIFYFRQILGRYGWRADITCLQQLATLEEERGNLRQSFKYMKELDRARDSLKAHSQVEETRKVKAIHDINLIKQERDAEVKHSHDLQLFLIVMATSIAIAVLIAALAWRSYKDRKARELAQERRLRLEEERKSKQSAEQIHTNELRIALLEQQLQTAQDMNDAVKAEKLRLEAQLLTTENESIKAMQEHSKAMQAELKASILYERIRLNAGKERFHLSDEEWQQLASLIDRAYDQFTVRLRNLYEGITEHELRICYLVKIGIASTDIGVMLYKSKAAIGMARQRLYKKLTGKSGTARQFNEFIIQF